MKDYEKLQKMIDESDNIVFFGGAGVSTESGIPDFRSKDGLYNQKYEYPPEQILSHSFFPLIIIFHNYRCIISYFGLFIHIFCKNC